MVVFKTESRDQAINGGTNCVSVSSQVAIVIHSGYRKINSASIEDVEFHKIALNLWNEPLWSALKDFAKAEIG